MPFTVNFALQVEAALADYIRPLVERISQAAEGKGKGDWRAAATLLQGRFPHEFSERVAVAKSQKVEVAGQISHSYSDQLQRMPLAELEDEMTRLDQQINQTTWGSMRDDQKDAWIGHFSAMLAKMKADRDGLSRWLGDVDWHLRPGLPVPVEDYQPPRRALAFEHEPVEVQAAAPKAAPAQAGAADVVAAASAAGAGAGGMSFEVGAAPRPTGIGFNRFGDAINLGDYADEDLSL